MFAATVSWMYLSTNHQANLASKLRLHLRQGDKCPQRSPQMKRHHWHSPQRRILPHKLARKGLAQIISPARSGTGLTTRPRSDLISLPPLRTPPLYPAYICPHNHSKRKAFHGSLLENRREMSIAPNFRIIPIQTSTIPRQWNRTSHGYKCFIPAKKQSHPSDSDAGGIPPSIKHGDELCARNLFMLIFFVE